MTAPQGVRAQTGRGQHRLRVIQVLPLRYIRLIASGLTEVWTLDPRSRHSSLVGLSDRHCIAFRTRLPRTIQACASGVAHSPISSTHHSSIGSLTDTEPRRLRWRSEFLRPERQLTSQNGLHRVSWFATPKNLKVITGIPHKILR